MAEFPSITPVLYQQDPNSVNRIGKKDIIPGSVTSRHFASDVIQLVGDYHWSFTLNSLTYTTIFLEVNTTDLDEMLPIVESFICQDTYDADHVMKGGSSVNPTNWDLYGPYQNMFSSNAKGAYYSLYVLNKDTVTHTVLCHMRVRFISAVAASSTTQS